MGWWLTLLKDLRTSTKLLLLCGAFVVSIILATYALIKEKQIAIEFVRKELIGTQYLEALQGVHGVVLARAGVLQVAPTQRSIAAVLETFATTEAETGGVLATADRALSLAAAANALSSARASDDKHALTVTALARARDLMTWIGDESNLTLDPDLDSYYVQDIVVKRMPALLSELGELQSLLRPAETDAVGEDVRLRAGLLDGMIRSTLQETERDSTAAVRGNPDGRLTQSLGPVMGALRSTIDSYLKAAAAAVSDEGQTVSLPHLFTQAVQSAERATTVSRVELELLLNKRLASL